MFLLSYIASHKAKNESVNMGGLWFDTEVQANNYMDIVAKDWDILEMNIIEKERTPRPSRTIIATSRSWE